MTVRPLLPYQSGIHPAPAVRSHWPGLFDGALPRSVKKLDPGSGLPLRLTPHGLRLAWAASKARVLTLSLTYRVVSVTPLLYPAWASSDLHMLMFPLPLLSGNGLLLT